MSDDRFFSKPAEYSQNIEITHFKNNKHQVLVFQKLYEFYQINNFVDIDLIVGPNTFRIQAHRIVLSACSEYFFDTLTSKPNASYLEVKDVDEVVMKSIVGYMYTSSIDLETNSLEAIFKAAELFKMSLLIEDCCSFMEKNINSYNCLGFARLGWEYDKPRIVKNSLAFAHDHFKEIRNGSEFFEMNSEILRELFSSDFLRVDSEEVVLQSLLDWANFDPANRHELLSDLLSLVRFELLNPVFIASIREYMSDIPNCDNIIFGWITCHIDNQNLNIIPKTRARNMNHTYSILCGESTKDWHIMTYNGVTDTWSRTELPNSYRKRTYFKSVITVDNRIFITGGKINGDNTASVECLDLETKTWNALPFMRESRVGHVMAMIRGNLFVIGGIGNQSHSLKSIERYNFQTRLWSLIGVLPSPIAYSHRHATINDRLYILDVHRPSKLMCFVGLLFEWIQYEFDHDVDKAFDMVAIGDLLYLCLVESNVKTLERFYPAENKWTVLNSEGIERFLKPRMFALGNKLIFWGKASDQSGSILVESYDIENENFTSLTPLNEFLYDLNYK